MHVATPDGEAVPAIRALGFQFHPMVLSRRGLNPFAEWATLRQFIRLFREVKPTIVHNLTIKPMIYGGLAARRTKVPCLVQAVTGLGHVFIATGPKAKAARIAVVSAYRVAFRHPNRAVIFQNPDDQATLIATGAVDADDSVLIRGSGVDLTLFHPLPEPSGATTVIFASRLIWPKGVREFVEAARLLKSRGSEVRMVLVGEPDPGNPASISRSDLEGWIREGVVEAWGFRKDMVEVFRQCHVVCLPSVYGEGVPRVLIEAAACSRPIVTTDAPGCREIVQDGRNGILVPAKDVAALADAIERLAGDFVLRQTMGKEGRALAESEFSLDSVIARTLAVYDRLLANAGIRADS